MAHDRPLVRVTVPAIRSRSALVSRRSVLAALVLGVPVLAACSAVQGAAPQGPDPLVALADSARADAALAASLLAADPSVRAQVEPLRAARAAHAAALDAALGRTVPSEAAAVPTTAARSSAAAGASAAPSAGSTAAAGTASTKELQSAVAASAKDAATAAMTLPPSKVGLVASIAACCSAYANSL